MAEERARMKCAAAESLKEYLTRMDGLEGITYEDDAPSMHMKNHALLLM